MVKVIRVKGQIVNAGSPVHIGVKTDNDVRRVIFQGVPTIGNVQTISLRWAARPFAGETELPGDIVTLAMVDEGYAWDVSDTITQYADRELSAYIRVDTPVGARWNTEPFRLALTDLPDVLTTATPMTITAIDQMLTAIATHRAEMTAQEQRVEDMVAEGGNQLAEVLDLADQVRTNAQGVAAGKDAAHVAMQTAIEHALDAYDSMIAAGVSQDQAAQAFADLLAMLGTQIATLGPDGKLTPGQIPPISINDVFPVPDTAAMLALTAERGDTAIIIAGGVVVDSYILMTDDPTQISNWAKLGVSYVANAGHAATADAATDSERINGKRIISMTQTQYDTAEASGTLDDDTLYIVTPDE